MRLPNRKPGKYTFPEFDPHMTQDKYDQLKAKLHHIKTVSQPKAIAETKLHGENGDFSENAEYQIAKGRLRGLNRAIDEISQQLNHAIIIDTPSDVNTIQIGHTVRVSVITPSGERQEIIWKILGSEESDPAAGIISYKSPVGEALLGKGIGEVAVVQLPDRALEYTVVSIA